MWVQKGKAYKKLYVAKQPNFFRDGFVLGMFT